MTIIIALLLAAMLVTLVVLDARIARSSLHAEADNRATIATLTSVKKAIQENDQTLLTLIKQLDTADAFDTMRNATTNEALREVAARAAATVIIKHNAKRNQSRR